MRNRYDEVFQRLKHNNELAFVPFVTLGDPNYETSLHIIQALIDEGCDALELGIPFSDPLADGPVIQQANLRALKHHINTQQCFHIIESIRALNPNIAIGLLVYANLVFKTGLDQFYQMAKSSGVDSILVADVPIHEAEPYLNSANKHHIAPVFMIPPNIDLTSLEKIASQQCAYFYLMSRPGVTGAELAATMPKQEFIEKIKSITKTPLLLGFGVSTPTQILEAKQAQLDGVISGSSVIKYIDVFQSKAEIIESISYYVRQMKQATRQN